jgi:hypothetical protein
MSGTRELPPFKEHPDRGKNEADRDRDPKHGDLLPHFDASEHLHGVAFFGRTPTLGFTPLGFIPRPWHGEMGRPL